MRTPQMGIQGQHLWSWEDVSGGIIVMLGDSDGSHRPSPIKEGITA